MIGFVLAVFLANAWAIGVTSRAYLTWIFRVRHSVLYAVLRRPHDREKAEVAGETAESVARSVRPLLLVLTNAFLLWILFARVLPA